MKRKIKISILALAATFSFCQTYAQITITVAPIKLPGVLITYPCPQLNKTTTITQNKNLLNSFIPCKGHLFEKTTYSTLSKKPLLLSNAKPNFIWLKEVPYHLILAI
ncbi:MAG: hypothetical protein JNL63_06790 [Bacteroidia bacterium]|nr:hypothetical protein [Bacteroidia bacterium]